MSTSAPIRTLVATAVVVEVEDDPLTLAQHAEDRAVERVEREVELLAVGVAHDDALVGLGVVARIDALHGAPPLYGFCTLPAFRQEVHTWSRLGVPSTMARTRWTLGFQRRFVRRCEWLRRMPNCGFLPQTSQTDAIEDHLRNGLGNGQG